MPTITDPRTGEWLEYTPPDTTRTPTDQEIVQMFGMARQSGKIHPATEPKPFEKPPEEAAAEPGFFDKMASGIVRYGGKSFGRMVGGMGAGIGGLIEAVTAKDTGKPQGLRFDPMLGTAAEPLPAAPMSPGAEYARKVVHGFGTEVRTANEELIDFYKEKDPNLFDTLAEGVYSGLAFLIPSTAIARSASVIGALGNTANAARIARALGIAGNAVTEAGLEAGNVFNSLVKKGMPESEAKENAFNTFAANVALIAITNKASTLFGAAKPAAEAAKKTLKQKALDFARNAAVEGPLQEAPQEAISASQSGEPITAANLRTAALAGSVAAGVMHGGISASDAIQRARTKPPTKTKEAEDAVPQGEEEEKAGEVGQGQAEGGAASQGQPPKPAVFEMTPKDVEEGKAMAADLGLIYMGPTVGYGGDVTMPAQHTFQIPDEGGKRGTSFTVPVGMDKSDVALIRDKRKEGTTGPGIVIDGLTGLPNGDTIRKNMEFSLDASKPLSAGVGRYGGEEFVAISDYGTKRDQVFIDIDKFKSINDVYGHDGGDNILTDIGKIAGEMLQDPKANNLERLKEFQKTIAETVKTPDGQPVTVSIGIAEGKLPNVAGKAGWKADRMLYLAKEGGRNQIRVDNGTETGYISRGPEVGEKKYLVRFERNQLHELATKQLKDQAVLANPELRRAYEIILDHARRAEEGGEAGEAGLRQEGDQEPLPGPSGEVAPESAPLPKTAEELAEYLKHLPPEERARAAQVINDRVQTEESTPESEIRAEDAEKDRRAAGLPTEEQIVQHVDDLRKRLASTFFRTPESRAYLSGKGGTITGEQYDALSRIAQDLTLVDEKNEFGMTRGEALYGRKFTGDPDDLAAFISEKATVLEKRAQGAKMRGGSEAMTVLQTDLLGEDVPVDETGTPIKEPPKPPKLEAEQTSLFTEEGLRMVGAKGPKSARRGAEGAEVGATEARLSGQPGTVPGAEGRQINRTPLPEMVQLIRRMAASGKAPGIRRALLKAHGQALGEFRHGVGKEPRINLRADIFVGPKVAEFRTGNEMVRQQNIATVKEKLTAAGVADSNIRIKTERRVTRIYVKDENFADKVVGHEAGHFLDYIPDGDPIFNERGNILGRMAGLFKYLKGTIDSVPSEPSQAIDKKDRAEIRRQVNRDMKGATAEEKAAERKARLQQMIEDRELITKSEIMGELKTVTREWNPFDEMAASPQYLVYRDSPKELYAEQFSMLLVDPGRLQQIAPKWWESMHAYMENKPEFKAIFDEIQNRIEQGPEALYEAREAEMTGGLRVGEEAWKEAWENRREPASLKGAWYGARKAIWKSTVFSEDALNDLRRAGIKIDPNANPRDMIELMQYFDAIAFENYREAENEVVAPLIKAGVTMDEFDNFLTVRRAATEYAEKAAPGGLRGEEAKAHLAQKEKTLGPEKWAAIQKAAKALWKIRNDRAIPLYKLADQWNDATMKAVADNENYATFVNVEKMYEDAYKGTGQVIPGVVQRAVGMLEHTASPFTATLIKDAGLMRAAVRKIMVKSFVNQFKSVPGYITRSDYSNAKGYTEILSTQDPGKATVTVLEHGKVVGYDMPKELAEIIDHSPAETNQFYLMAANLSAPMRALFITYNVPWIARNFHRDIVQTAINLKGANIASAYSHVLAALPDAYLDVMKNVSTPRVKEMYDKGELIVGRIFKATAEHQGEEYNPQTQLDRMAESFVGLKGARYQRMVGRPWEKFIHELSLLNPDMLGRISERASKIGGKQLLLELPAYKGKSEGEISHIVRERISTPNVKAGGTARMLINNLWLFSNANMRGLEAAWESLKENPLGYVTKNMMYNIGPKMLLRTAELGGIAAVIRALMPGDRDKDDEKKIVQVSDKFQKWAKGIPEYDATNYHCVPLPPLLTESGKSVYLKVVPDFQGQMYSAFAWKLSDLKFGDALRTAASMLPGTNPNPYLGAAIAWSLYAGAKVNPPDAHLGRDVVSQSAWGTKGATPEMIDWTVQTLGASALPIPRQAIRDWLDMIPGMTFKADTEKEIADEFAQKWGVKLSFVDKFIGVSDRGHAEKLREVGEEASKRVREASFDRRNTVVEAVNREEEVPTRRDKNAFFKSLRAEAQKEGTKKPDRAAVNRLWDGAVIARFKNDEMMAIFRADTREAKEAIANRILDDKDYDQAELLKIARVQPEIMKQTYNNLPTDKKIPWLKRRIIRRMISTREIAR
jgi:GGDEF domain-containing protein